MNNNVKPGSDEWAVLNGYDDRRGLGSLLVGLVIGVLFGVGITLMLQSTGIFHGQVG